MAYCRKSERGDNYMTEEEYLAHFGILGMKWGKRKAKTPEIEETPAQRRERVLLSTNAKLVYDNRYLLTTAELNDRINRINTEQKLAELSASEKTSVQQKIDKILKMGKTANELYQVYKQPVVQDMITKLSGKSTSINYKKMLENVNDLSTAQITELAKRAASEKALRSFVEGTGQSDTNSDHLEHFGVLGMKWGKHKTNSTPSGRKKDKAFIKYVNSKHAAERKKGLDTLDIRELFKNRDFLLPQEIDEKLETITLDKKIKALKNTGNLEKLSTALFDKNDNRSFAQKVDYSLEGTGLEKSFEKINKVLNTKLKTFSEPLDNDETIENRVMNHPKALDKKLSDAIEALDDPVIKYLDF